MPILETIETIKIMAALVAAYLVGSISFAVLICRLRGRPDPRSLGSRNPGATNVARAAGRTASALTLLGDAGKGYVVVLAARSAGFDDVVVALATAAVFLGHLYPVYHRFEGGKGVATCMGCTFGLHPLAGLAWVGVWLAAAGAFRYVAAAGVAAGLAAPLLVWWSTGRGALVAAVAAMGALILARHRANLRRIARGEEDKLFS